MSTNVFSETADENIRVARFIRPDVRPALYDQAAAGDTALFKELRTAAIDPLPDGGALVLNFGLIDWFPTMFYSLLLKTQEAVRAKNGRLVLCCLTANPKEGFDLMGGGKTFEVHATEARALAAVKK